MTTEEAITVMDRYNKRSKGRNVNDTLQAHRSITEAMNVIVKHYKQKDA